MGLILDREHPLEEGMATHSSILAWRIPMNRGAWWATVHGAAKSQTRLKQLSSHKKFAERMVFKWVHCKTTI